MNNTHRKQQGFTLIELMIVVGIIAILAAIALPSYQGHVMRSRRSAAESCLQERAQYMERYYTTNLSYVDSSSNPPAVQQCDAALQPFYQISYGTPAPAARTYVLQAVPQGIQAAKDTQCGTLSIDQKGTRAPTGCWQ